jgi:hypothetical protein
VPSPPGTHVDARPQRQGLRGEVEMISYHEKIEHGIYLYQLIVHVISHHD